ncbi:MAG: OPT/YSL family transporter [Clostridiales bacterium]|nr:OPT/YSL family transporter [Clostridiales bacterium]
MKIDTSNVKHATSFRGQFTVRGIVIGAIGSIILTCSSTFVALKASSLPWPIMFVTLVSMFSLKALGNTNVNEINVTHTAMSAGSMVAGGLAFTIPGIFILNPDAEFKVLQIMLITLGGTVLGLIFTSLLRKHFIEDADMPYAMGQAAAELVVVGDEGGSQTKALFGSLAAAGVWTVLRDGFGKVPSLTSFNFMAKYGSSAGMWWSPMMVAVGYLIGPATITVWFIGALIGDVGILMVGQMSGLWDAATAAGIKSSMGLGWMVGVGIAITAKEIIPRAKSIFGGMFKKGQAGDAIVSMRWAPFVILALAILFIFVLDLPIVAVIITLLGAWLTTAMSAQCVGQSGINPMEVFGIFIMAIAKYCCGLTVTQAVFIAAIIAVAAGLTGDIMNDFKSGSILKTDPKAQWYGDMIGGIIGAVVAVGVMLLLVKAYGGGIFGSDMFPAAQAAAVASVVGGIANIRVFVGALIISIIVYFITPKFTMLGLGIYLPFYLSFTGFVGGALRFVVQKAAPKFSEKSTGTVVASGLLAGEGFIGVVIAIIQAISILMAG